MKKLLSLLSVLTISGTAIPTTIAASSYEYEKNDNSKLSEKVELEINELCKNNRNGSNLCSRIKDNTKKRVKRMGQIININSLIPDTVEISLPHGFLVRNNPPSDGEIKNTIGAASQLPEDFPYRGTFKLSYISRHGVMISVNNVKHNGDTYTGTKYVSFIDI